MTETESMTASGTEPTSYDVVLVGGGFSGIYQLRRLRELGYTVILLEAGDGLGGVWNLTRYPGARVDGHAPIYQFSDEAIWRDWNWSEFFPDHREMRRYFDYVGSKLDLKKDCRFGARVVSADFDEADATWTVRTADGAAFRAPFVVFATGSTNTSYAPPFPGAGDYQGTLVHTAKWRSDVDFTGKRVAVIGTGASGLQIVQEAGPLAAHLTVFQRTPNLSLPMRQRPLDAEDNARLRKTYPEIFAHWAETFAGVDSAADPRKATEVSDAEREAIYEAAWQAGGLTFWMGTFHDTLMDEQSNAYAYAFWKKKIRSIIKDPAKADLLAPHEPPHPFGAKRPALHISYYDVLNQDNVSIVPVRDNPIECFTANGIRTADGTEHVFDIIVLATGYDNNTGALNAIDIRGTKGRTLREKWASGVDALLGAMTNEFPNILFLYGPQSPAGFANGSASAELQGEVIAEFLDFLHKNGHRRFESSVDADTGWTAEIAAIDAMTLFNRADSWYNGGNIPGKHRQMLQYPGGLPLYLEHWRAQKACGYSDGIRIG